MRFVSTLCGSNAGLNNSEIIKLWGREKGIEFLLRAFDSHNETLRGKLYCHVEKLMDDTIFFIMNGVEMKDLTKMNIYRFSRVSEMKMNYLWVNYT